MQNFLFQELFQYLRWSPSATTDTMSLLKDLPVRLSPREKSTLSFSVSGCILLFCVLYPFLAGVITNWVRVFQYFSISLLQYSSISVFRNLKHFITSVFQYSSISVFEYLSI